MRFVQIVEGSPLTQRPAHKPAGVAPRTPRVAREQSCFDWSLLKRSIANFAAAGQVGLDRIIKRKPKKIQYRPHLINGCLAATGLKIEPW